MQSTTPHPIRPKSSIMKKVLLYASVPVFFSALYLVNRGGTPTQAPPFDAAPKASPPSAVAWLTLDQVQARMKAEPRKIFIDLYTDWCGWCVKMDESTFSSKQVAAYLNDNFYAVKFNAEQKEDVVFNGKRYTFTGGQRGYNTLAAALAPKLAYPMSIFLDENYAVLGAEPGYKDAQSFQKLLLFYAAKKPVKQSSQQ